MFSVIGIKKRLDEQTRVLEKILAAVLSTGQLTEQDKASILKTTEPSDDELMAKYGITSDGQKYYYGSRRFGKLENAVDYATKRRKWF